MNQNRYNIRIDGEVMPNSFTYEELLLNDILDFDDIEVKQVTKTNWTNIKSFYFPEEHDQTLALEDNYSIGEDGQAHFKDKNILLMNLVKLLVIIISEGALIQPQTRAR